MIPEDQRKYTDLIRKQGYQIRYEFTKDMYAAYVYFPWQNSDEGLVYSQGSLTDFYKNLYNFVKNN